jgi:hypothetical protein
LVLAAVQALFFLVQLGHEGEKSQWLLASACQLLPFIQPGDYSYALQ